MERECGLLIQLHSVGYSCLHGRIDPKRPVLPPFTILGWTSAYSLGLLEWNGGNPTLPSSWVKSGPVFSSANSLYGTAHNGFFTSPDGRETWLVYHASKTDPAKCDGSRVTMAQKCVALTFSGVSSLGLSGTKWRTEL